MSYATNAPVRALGGLDPGTRGWPKETACRLPLKNLEVAQRRNGFIVRGGRGKAVRDRDCCFRTIDMLEA